MPLPETMELQSSSTKQWPLIPPDIYQAEITEIEYKEVDNMYKKEATDPDKKQVMEFEFTIIEDGPHYGRKFWKKMTPTKPTPGRDALSICAPRVCVSFQKLQLTQTAPVLIHVIGKRVG